ncbi:2-hydroxychromene-2-carboxylate isomerase [Dongia deserti]|uniref:2-hydroxychromene-2-carboxylate isomerase n=1 Tax=Dongia deserti TaxID=2268030 RepID=UPI0013C411D0|nr:DsbA family protein [Dongia deserti]
MDFFFFGLGSRYSYLAATQVSVIAHETGAAFAWRPLYSRVLIERAGPNPFAAAARRGQYDPAYRAKDAQRWAQHYGVPYREPDWVAVDWQALAFACVAAELLGVAEGVARSLFSLCFDKGQSRFDEDLLVELALQAGAPAREFRSLLRSGKVQARHEQNVAAALAAGAFGVPTFVVDGELFWGQDKLPLLCDHLMR